MAPATIDELIGCVEQSYWDQPIATTENIFLYLQKCMECVMVEGGGNTYSLPHMGKNKMRKDLVQMPLTIQCSQDAVDTALEILNRHGA